MDLGLVVLLAIAAVWLAAGVVAEGLPRLPTAVALHRRTGLLAGLAALGLVGLGGVVLTGLLVDGPTVADRVAVGLMLPAGSAVTVALLTVRRVYRLRRGAGAFASAPRTPAPPTLRAAAAHPLVASPVQVTALVMLPVLVDATGLVPLDSPGGLGVLLTGVILVVGAIGVRHALRHSSLAEHAVTVRTRSSGTRVLHV
ncbi:hypothetical protein [Micromonospora sp. HM5-17]|uniref:hypothetical protein n=1 Tax=Micromonospora sp. HM5-17 TaxID=2487710 RepID=UPI000F487446|nr:hypothetical protein [Micromonospora sp. HM5-17]ROT33569.1 hypothetical protein EF879_01010 [Micromonospora sp. HM5-17]